MEQRLILKNEILKINIQSLETKIKDIESKMETKIKDIEKKYKKINRKIEKQFNKKYEKLETRINSNFCIFNSNFNNINLHINNMKILIENNKIEKCSVCYEFTTLRPSCNHFLCEECYDKLEKDECPICRKELP